MTITEMNLPYAKDLLQKYLKKKTINNKGCFIPHKVPRKEGYVRISVTPGNTEKAFGGYYTTEKYFYLHQLAWHAAGKDVPLDSAVMHLSHLCSTPNCFNVDHIVLETPLVNNSRKNCGVDHDCPKCGHVFSGCKHEPKCITEATARRPFADLTNSI